MGNYKHEKGNVGPKWFELTACSKKTYLNRQLNTPIKANRSILMNALLPAMFPSATDDAESAGGVKVVSEKY